MAKNKTTKHEETDNQEQSNTINAVDTKFLLAKKLLANIKHEIASLERILNDGEVNNENLNVIKTQLDEGVDLMSQGTDGRVIEGVFDGQNMVGSDGNQYTIPPNYASKSKLVEGDILKLTIQGNGGFLFKQIGPIERERIVGLLIKDENTQDWKALAEGRKFNVLPASISYFKGEAGDGIVLLIPKSAPSRWAAVENVIKKEGNE